MTTADNKKPFFLLTSKDHCILETEIKKSWHKFKVKTFFIFRDQFCFEAKIKKYEKDSK